MILAAALIATLAQAPSEDAVLLVCKGTGNRRNLHANQPYQDVIRVEIYGSQGRMQLPVAMLPPEMKGGDNGWYEMRDLVRTDSAYKAKVRVNFINFPSIVIDRVTGVLNIDGGQSGFSGSCERLQAAKPLF